MSKKQIRKKKIGLKLVPNETAVVLQHDIFMHIAQTYDYLAGEEEDSDYRDWFYQIADVIRLQANENYFEDSGNQEEYEW